jgi:hypothetical protein
VRSPELSTDYLKNKLAAVIATGGSIKLWAKANQVPERTAYRWSADPRVKAEIAQARMRSLDRAISEMSRCVRWAVAETRDMAESASSESVRLAALKQIFSNMTDVAEFAEMQHRIAQLEEWNHERARTFQPRKAD